jgi:hypothetical protein
MAYPIFSATIVALLFTASLKDCAFLTRFQQESYDCSRTQAPFTKLVFNRMSRGESAKVEGAAQSSATITEVTDTRIDAVWGNDSLSVNRTSGAVTVTVGNVVRSYACTKAQFKM